MHKLPLAEIQISENRQRKEFIQENINELAESIRTHGLYHPIVISSDETGYRLLAGERRLRAISQLAELEIGFACGHEWIESGYIPCTLLPELSDLERREIELEENVIRVDLTWQEKAKALADLTALRKEQKPGTTNKEIAHEVFGPGADWAIDNVSTAIVLAKHLDDPDVAKAKSTAEAKKIVQKKLETKRREKLAESVDISKVRHAVLEGDSLTLLHSLEDGKFQCIITDPPYGIGADGFGSQAKTAHAYDDTEDYGLQCYDALAKEGYRVAAKGAHLYAFCTIELWQKLSDIFTTHGWSVWPRPLIWWKGPNAGMLPRPEHGPRYTYEAVLFAIKGDKKTLCVKPDVIAIPPVSDKVHAAEKPVDLYLDLLSRSCLPGDEILDPFAGSGVVFTAAHRAKLTATGIELNPDQIVNCKLRAKGE